MRKSKPRQFRLFLVLALCMIGACIWSWQRQEHAAKAAWSAGAEADTCQHIASRIEALRQRPMVAGSRELELTDLTRRIEQSAQVAQMPSNAIVRISPQPAIRVGDHIYKEKPTQIALRAVTLKQITVFLHSMSAATDGANLQVKDLRLTAPREAQANELWSAEATLSYLIYSPQTSSTSTR